MIRTLLIVGSGGFGREILDTVSAINDRSPTWRVGGFLDDDAGRHGRVVAGAAVLGPSTAVHDHPEALLVVATGSPDDFTSRQRIVERLGLPAWRYATIVHPAASISRTSTVGPGTAVLAGAVATSNVRIGAHVAVMPHAVMTHDGVIGDFATLASGAALAGGVSIGQGAYIGAGAAVRERRRVGAWALVGMGAGVHCDIPEGEAWAGTPARYLRQVRVLPGADLPAARPPGPAARRQGEARWG